MLANIYNHMYSPNAVRRSAGDRLSGQSELRELCSRIVRKNALSPVYLLKMDNEKRDLIINMKEDALSLSELLQELDPAQSSLYTSCRAVSDHPGLVSAELTPLGASELTQSMTGQNVPAPASLLEPVTLQIHSLAMSQRNAGAPVYADSHILEPGSYRFQADVEENLYQFQFNITPGSTNRDIITKLSAFLNKSDIGIRSELEELEDSRIRMCLESEAVGNVNLVNFSLEDIEYPSNGRGLIDFLGLNHTERFPSNASFSLNGSEKELTGNEFTLNQRLHVTFLAASGETVLISYVPDTAGIQDKLDEFLTQYNTFLQTGETAMENQSCSPALFRNLQYVLTRHASSLEACGITLSEGTLTADPEGVSAAVQDGSLKKLFAADSPFVRDLRQELNQILLDPVQYTTRKIVSYPNTARQNFLSPYAVSQYSGLFYNQYL